MTRSHWEWAVCRCIDEGCADEGERAGPASGNEVLISVSSAISCARRWQQRPRAPARLFAHRFEVIELGVGRDQRGQIVGAVHPQNFHAPDQPPARCNAPLSRLAVDLELCGRDPGCEPRRWQRRHCAGDRACASSASSPSALRPGVAGDSEKGLRRGYRARLLALLDRGVRPRDGHPVSTATCATCCP